MNTCTCSLPSGLSICFSNAGSVTTGVILLVRPTIKMASVVPTGRIAL